MSPPEKEPFFSTVTYEGEETAQAGGKQGVDERITVLVVEDDHLIQAMLEEALSDGGFATATVASGEEAIAILKPDSSKSKVCAVLTDINLLGSLDGWEVARVAREIDPTMPVLYMSGTHADQWASRSVPQSVILLKPFAPAQVVTAVSNLSIPQSRRSRLSRSQTALAKASGLCPTTRIRNLARGAGKEDKTAE